MEAIADADLTAGIIPAGCLLAYGRNAEGLCWWCGSAVPAGRYEWCSQRCEAAAETAHVWSRANRAALDRAAHRCQVLGCADRKVQVHHLVPVALDGSGYAPGCQHHPDNLAVRCSEHHAAEHRELRAKKPTQMALFRAA
jgi:hypothetical protein